MLEGLRSLFHQALRFDGNDATVLVMRWNEEIDYIQSVFDNMASKKPKLPICTNADRIRAMTDEEMADFIGDYTCPPSYNDSGGCERSECCEDCWFNWLKQEVPQEVTNGFR